MKVFKSECSYEHPDLLNGKIAVITELNARGLLDRWT